MAAIVLIVDVLILTGSWAPQGWAVRHVVTHPELDPQLLAHWLADSVHSKYGMVLQ